jgi:adenylosuccinate synthase
MFARAVIGSLYGDEGKGLMTDYFAAQARKLNVPCTVVRSNGGAQAGHTVVTPEGVRHVFHHFGSGTLAGASTHLSRYMIVNPIMFNREWDALVALGVEPVVSVSPECLVTFPQDMMLNQMFEFMRGDSRHGSCGMGIGETMERVERYREAIPLSMVRSMKGHLPTIQSRLAKVREQRIADMGFTYDDLPPEYRDLLDNREIFQNFVADLDLMVSRCTLKYDGDLDISNAIIFEGAQGLALDRDMGFFPFVTRSKTGLFNITKLCKEMGITDLQVVYAMRSYTSRHGAGPLDGEGADMSGFGIVDETNHPNDWQGTIRAAPLDLWLVNRMTSLDMMAAAKPGLTITKAIALTCIDQAPEVVPVFGVDRFHQSILREKLFEEAIGAVGAAGGWMSRGPTRDSIDPMWDQMWMT